MKKKVYICASMDGDVETVLERVKAYVNYALKCGVAPVAPHFHLQAMLPDTKANAEILRSASCPEPSSSNPITISWATATEVSGLFGNTLPPRKNRRS